MAEVFYSFLLNDSRNDTLHVYKASDPTSSWAAESTYVFDGPIFSVWGYQVGNVVHLAVAGLYQDHLTDSSPIEIAGEFAYVKYLAWDADTDTWTVLDEQADAVDVSVNLPTLRLTTALALRSDGDVIVVYPDSSDGVSYSRRESGSWTSGVAVSTTTTSVTPSIVMGDSDLAHILWGDETADDSYHRSLSSTNTLGTEQIVEVDGFGAGGNRGTRGVVFNDGTARVRGAWIDGLQVRTAYGNDVTNPTWTTEGDATDTFVAVGAWDMAIDGQISRLSMRGADADLYCDENDGIGGWGTDLEVVDAVTVDAVSATVYTRATIKRLATIYSDNGTTTVYVEKDIVLGEVDLVHTTDALLKAQQDLTHATDALKKATFDRVHSTDAFKKGGQDITHDTDALLKKANDLIHSTDALLKKSAEINHSTDALLANVVDLDHTTDALLKAVQELSHGTDSRLKKSAEITHDTDALLKALTDAQHSTDALLANVVDLSHSTDAALKKEQDSTHSTDALLKKAQELAHSTDALLNLLQELSHSTDAFLRAGTDLVHSTDAFLEGAGDTAAISFAQLETPDVVRHGIITWVALEVPRIGTPTENLFNKIKDFNEELLLEELDAVGLKPPLQELQEGEMSGLLFAGFDPDFDEPDRRIWTPSAAAKISYGSLAQPGDLRFSYPFTLTTEDITTINAVLDAHNSGDTTAGQDSEDQDDNDLDQLRTYFDKPCGTLTQPEHDDAVCRLLRLVLRFHRGDII